MSTSGSSLSERAAESIQKLSLAATDLNKASDELGEVISAIDAVLHGLRIGLSTWTIVKETNGLPEDSFFSRHELGYAKVGNKWGIALRKTTGDFNYPPDDSVDLWLFNEAPRRLRMEAVEEIPNLLEALITNTVETTKKLRTKTAEAMQLATAIAQAAGKKSIQGSK
jgi:hypothetical protein